MSNVDFYEEFAPEYSLFFSDLRSNMEAEGAWLAAVLQGEEAHTILDASCGSGRQTIPLAERGFDVTAADPSPAMLAEAWRLASERGLELQLYPASFLELPDLVGRRFDVVVALGNGLCHEESCEDIARSLGALKRCCRPGGLCLIGIKDFDTIRKDRPRFHGHTVRDVEGERTVLFEVWDYRDPLLLCTAYCVRSAGERLSTRAAQTREYMLGEAELRSLARRAGFISIGRLDHPCEAVFALRQDSSV